jgi:hypothetical protein
MKDLIIAALDEAFITLVKRVPLTRKETKQKSISDVEPLQIASFMEKNGIPNDAWFDGIDNGYDGYSDVCLSWYIEVPTTKEEQLKYKRDNFERISHTLIFKTLKSNGYKRKGFLSSLLKEFKDTTVFDMYANKDFDRLVDYYSLFYGK